MVGLRYEKYEGFINDYPFSLQTNIERTPYNLSTEQNWHDNIEIQLFTKGEGTVLIDGEKYNIRENDIAVVDSNAVHYTSTSDYLSYTCLIVSTDWCRLMNIPYDTLHFSPIVKSVRVASLIEKLTQVVISDNDSLRVAKSNGILLEIMIELSENFGRKQENVKQRNKNFNAIVNAITFIRKSYSQKITLSQISDEVYIDKYTLCKEFKRFTGQTVIEYLNSFRCIKAKELLSEGKTVAEASAACGFDNLSFFTKIFKRYTGQKPSFYKKKVL